MTTHSQILFSIVVPVFNRAGLIDRCIESVLSQAYPNYELVIVDDGSTDASVQRVQAYDDERIRLIELGENRGVGTARNTGVDAAKAPWIVFLDSDDELLPGALERMAQAVDESRGEVHALWFRCVLDDGSLSPAEVPAVTEWDYHGYMRFIESTAHRMRDMIRCVKRECFQTIRYPTSRLLGTKYHLDFAKLYRSRMFPDVLRKYHQDATDRLALRGQALDRLDANSKASESEEFVRAAADGFGALIDEHGDALRQFAPSMYVDYLRRAAVTALRAGRRGAARRLAWRLVVARPTATKGWWIWLSTFRARQAHE